MEEKRSCCCGALPAAWWWLLTLLGLPLLFLLMLNSRQGIIENDLASRSEAGLKTAGMDWVKVNLAGRGRDVQLEGTAVSEEARDQAARLVQGIYGVRDVHNLLEVAAPKTVAADSVAMNADPQLQAPVAPIPPEQPSVPEAPVAPETPVALTPPEQPVMPESGAPVTLDAPVASVAPEQPVAPEAPGQSRPDATQEQQRAVTEPDPKPVDAKPEPTAEEKAAQDCQQQLNDAMTGKTILFATNKAAIKQDSMALLDSLVGIVSSCKDVIANRGIQVSGHTDNVGNDAYNQNLSQRRADAVRDYFVQKGIDGALVKSMGYGESKPVASNDNEAGRSQNRRITFEISPE